MITTNKRDYFFDNTKGLLIFLVVFGHALKPLMEISTLAKFLYAFIYTFHMPFFVFISGYFSKKNDFKKVLNLIYTYLIWQMIICPLALLVFGFNLSQSFEMPYYPQWTYWYLLTLIFWRIITPKIDKFKNLFALSILASIFIGFLTLPWGLFALGRAITFYPFFILGYKFIDTDIKKYKNKLNPITSILILASLSILTYVIFIYGNLPLDAINMRGSFSEYTSNMLFGAFIRLLLYTISVGCTISISNLIVSKKTVLSQVGKNSILIYLTHGFIIKGLEYHLDYSPLKSNPLLGLLIIALISIIYCYFLSRDYIYSMFKFTFSIPYKKQ